MVRIHGHVQDFDARPNDQHFFRNFGTAHLRHHDISEQQMNRSLMLGAGHQGLDPMAGFEHGIAMQP